MQWRALLLDANILIRATLDERVRRILETHAENISFFVPDAASSEAEEHLAALVVKRGGDPTKALRVLKAMAAITTMVGNEVYGDFEAEERKRLGARDPEDWPILAAAPRSRLPDLDRGHGLLRMWRRHLDLRKHRHHS